jgi:sigma-B regulation protein RsbU (phosphoserine phosphatase)
MTKSRPPRVALLLRGGSYTYQDEIIIGAHQLCTSAGADLYCLSGGIVTTADPRNFIYALPGPEDVDAAVIVKATMGAHDGDAVVGALLQRLRSIPTCIVGPAEPGVRCIAVDNASGVRGLTRHLLEKHERRRLAFVSGHGRDSDQRLAGFRAAHRDRGLIPDESLIIRGNFRLSGGQDAVARLFDGRARCDAIVAANDWMALGMLEALRARGIRVPEDVAVVGFDDIDEARFATPPLTTVRQSPRQLGIEAARLVLSILGGGDARNDVVVATLPQIRQSCGCTRGPRLRDGQPPAHGSPNDRRHDYGAWIQAMAARGPTPDPSVPEDWAARMVDSLRRDLEDGTNQRFIATFDDIVGRAAELDDVRAWHQPIAALRREVIRALAFGTDSLALAESIFERAHILMGDHAERAQGRRRLETEAAWRALEELGTEVRACLDRPAIGRALAAHLPGLHVRSCAVVVHATKRPPTSNDEARLIISWDQERGLSTFDAGVGFPARELAPKIARPPRRHTLMVQPLWAQRDALGWCLLEMDPPRAAICESIPAQISASLAVLARNA